MKVNDDVFSLTWKFFPQIDYDKFQTVFAFCQQINSFISYFYFASFVLLFILIID